MPFAHYGKAWKIVLKSSLRSRTRNTAGQFGLYQARQCGQLLSKPHRFFARSDTKFTARSELRKCAAKSKTAAYGLG
jgi:hypothetical protein